MIFTNNHPVRFNLETPCGLIDTKYVQPVQCGDITQFQIQLEICASEHDMIENGDFVEPTSAPWSETGNWAYDQASGTYTKQAGAIGWITQTFNVANDVLLKVEIDVDVFNGSMGFLAGNVSETIVATGAYTFYVVADNFVGVLIGGATDVEFTLNSFSVTPVNTNVHVQLVDRDDNVVRLFTPSADPQYFVFAGKYVTFSFDWNDEFGECLPEGCYRFKVSDPCECGNGGFVAQDLITAQGQWVDQGGAWSFGGSGVAVYGGSPDPDDVFVNGAVCDGVEYRVSYELAAMNSGNMFYVRCGAQLGAFRNASGTYTETIVANGSTINSFSMVGVNGGGGAFQVLSLSFERVDRDFGFASNYFDLRAEHPCTCVVKVCNNYDGMRGGFVGTGFAPRIRLKVTYGLGKYLEESDEYEFDDGYKERYHFRQRKVRDFSYNVPEYVHDFMSTIRGYNNVFIGDEAVFVEGSEYPDPNYKDNWNQAPVTLEISPKAEITENIYITSEIKTCSIDGQGVVVIIDGGPDDGSGEVGGTADGDVLLTTG